MLGLVARLVAIVEYDRRSVRIRLGRTDACNSIVRNVTETDCIEVPILDSVDRGFPDGAIKCRECSSKRRIRNDLSDFLVIEHCNGILNAVMIRAEAPFERPSEPSFGFGFVYVPIGRCLRR
ncbi:hypothetical protein BRC82_08080 [Halobacteriales archaeon QS_1_67_19]|nr:MAG: hypothetical protein BRC82_08080 [Halobacteriales archaeon QS_1_67_19]